MALAVSAPSILAACSSPNGVPAASTASSKGANTDNTSTSPDAAWTSCKDVPLATINAALGLQVSSPEQTEVSRTSTCGYTQSGSPSPLIVQIVTGASAAEFRAAVEGFKRNDGHPATVEGLGDQAVSVTLVAGNATTTSLMARLGRAQVLVAAPVSLQQLSALVKEILPRV